MGFLTPKIIEISILNQRERHACLSTNNSTRWQRRSSPLTRSGDMCVAVPTKVSHTSWNCEGVRSIVHGGVEYFCSTQVLRSWPQPHHELRWNIVDVSPWWTMVSGLTAHLKNTSGIKQTMRCTACTAWALHREGIAQVFGDTKVRDLDCWAQQRNCGANFHSPAILYAHHPPSILCEKDFERILSLSVSYFPWLCFLITVHPATSAWRSCVGCWLQKGSRRLLALTAPREFTRMLPKFDRAESRRRRQQCEIAACICRAKPWLLCISFAVDSKPRKLT